VTVSRYAKSIVAAAVAGLTVLAAALTDDTITTAEWVQIAVAVLGAIGVYAVPNRPPAGEPADPRISEQGHSLIETILVALLVSIVVTLTLLYFR